MVARSTYYTYYYLPAYYNYTPASYYIYRVYVAAYYGKYYFSFVTLRSYYNWIGVFGNGGSQYVSIKLNDYWIGRAGTYWGLYWYSGEYSNYSDIIGFTTSTKLYVLGVASSRGWAGYWIDDITFYAIHDLYVKDRGEYYGYYIYYEYSYKYYDQIYKSLNGSGGISTIFLNDYYNKGYRYVYFKASYYYTYIMEYPEYYAYTPAIETNPIHYIYSEA